MAAVVVLCLFASFALYATSGEDPERTLRWRDPKVERATADLAAAAVELTRAPGARFTGEYASGDDRVSVDARVTNEGTALATLRTEDGTAEVLTTATASFVRAKRDFWRAHGTPDRSLKEFSKQWVKVPPNFFDIDLSLLLTPGVLAEVIAPVVAEDPDPAASRAPPTPGKVTTVNGTRAQAITANGLTVYVTTTVPKQIVRITSAAPGEPSASPTVRHSLHRGRATISPVLSPTGVDDLRLDLATMSPNQVETFFRALKKRISELRNAVDSQVRFSLSGAIQLAPCTSSGCVATLTIRNQVTSTSPYLSVNKPVRASITIMMTLDGRPVAQCRHDKTMRPNGSATVRCRASYYIPRSRNPRVHTVRATAHAVARAMVSADLKKLASDLADELARNRDGRSRTKPTPTEPEPSREPGGKGDPPCKEPPNGNRGGGPGQWRDVNRGEYDALWKRYQEQISGVKRGKEYRYNDVDYDGFRSEGGRHVFIEAKSIGYSRRLRGAVVGKDGRVIADEYAELKLEKLLDQLRRQLRGVMGYSDARLRYVMAEQDALDKIKAYAKQRLSPEQFERIDWEQVDVDFDFKGCK